MVFLILKSGIQISENVWWIQKPLMTAPHGQMVGGPAAGMLVRISVIGELGASTTSTIAVDEGECRAHEELADVIAILRKASDNTCRGAGLYEDSGCQDQGAGEDWCLERLEDGRFTPVHRYMRGMCHSSMPGVPVAQTANNNLH
jgi:hypothetical protein